MKVEILTEHLYLQTGAIIIMIVW